MLLTHLMPDHIVIGKDSPPLTDLSGFAKRCRIQTTEDLERDLGWQSAEEVNTDELPDITRKI